MKLFERKVTHAQLTKVATDICLATGLGVDRADEVLKVNPHAGDDTLAGTVAAQQELLDGFRDTIIALLDHLGLQVGIDFGVDPRIIVKPVTKPVKVKVTGKSKRVKVPVRIKK